MGSEAEDADVVIGDGPLTWVGVLAELLDIAGGGGGESSQNAGPRETAANAEPTPSVSSSGAPAVKAAGRENGAAARETALVLLNDTGSGGPPAEVPVNGLLAVDFVDGVPVFEELAATSVGDATHRICVLDVRLQGEASADVSDDASRKFLCLRSLSTRVRVNGKPIGNKWLPLQEGDALGFGHIDAAESAARTVYAITYAAGDAQCRAHATAVAFARDRLAEYSIAVPLDVVKQSSISQLLRPEKCKSVEQERSAASTEKREGQPEKQQQHGHEVSDWASRAQKALQVLFAAGPIARAIAASSRKLFIEWAKDEASARGTSFATLDRVGIAISKCYEASAFIVPPATYWADEGLVKCMGLLRREAESGGEMGRAQKMLQGRVQAALGAEDQWGDQKLDDGLAGLVVRELVEEFDQQRCGDMEIGLDALVERVWKDVGHGKVKSFAGGSGEWARYHLDLRGRITSLGACSNFAEELQAFISSLRKHRNKHLAADALNHALAMALVKKCADAIRAVVAELRALGLVGSSTFQAWLLQARRDARWPAISSASAFKKFIQNGKDTPLVQAVLATMEQEGLQPAEAAGAAAAGAAAAGAAAVLATRERWSAAEATREGTVPVAAEDRVARAMSEALEQALVTGSALTEHAETTAKQDKAEGGQRRERQAQEASATNGKGQAQKAGGCSDVDKASAKDPPPKDNAAADKPTTGSSWHWLVATTKELTNDSKAHRPDAFKNLQKYIQRVVGITDDGIVCIKWEHVQVFSDCHPMLGFRNKQDASKAMDSWDLQSLQLVPVALEPREGAGGSGRPNGAEPRAAKATAGRQKRSLSPSSEAAAKKRRR